MDIFALLAERVIADAKAETDNEKIAAIDRAAADPWVRHGAASVLDYLGAARCTGDEANLWSFAYAKGASDALHLAALVIANPAVEGNEIEALVKLVKNPDPSAVISLFSAKAGQTPGRLKSP